MQETGPVLSKIEKKVTSTGVVVSQNEPPSLFKTNNITLADHACFMGLGYDASGKLPIELATIVLSERQLKCLKLLIADYFLSFNNMPKEEIVSGRAQMKSILERLATMLHCTIEIDFASDHMLGEEYQEFFKEINVRLEDPKLQAALIETLPKRVRGTPTALLYPIHEIGISEYLRRKCGVTAKIGPDRELLYDRIMEQMGLPLRFAYILDTLPLGPNPKPVVPYIASHHGSHAERIFLNDTRDELRAKLSKGTDESLRNLACAGSVAGYLRHRIYCTDQELQALKGAGLKEVTDELLWKNIIEPLNLREFPL